MSQISNICKKYDKDVNDHLVIELREVLKNKLGYFPIFAKWLFSNKVDINGLKEITSLLNEIKIHKPISDFKSSEELYDFLTETRNKSKLNQVIKSIPSHSRSHISKRIKDVIYSNIDKEEILKDYFSKKGGRSKTEDDLYQRTLEVINDGGSSNYTDILKKINNVIKPSFFKRISNFFGWLLEFPSEDNSKIVYKDGVNIILKVTSYEVNRKLGSNHWCISSSKNLWDNYTKDGRTQYFIWQTDKSNKESMIGVTVTKFLGIIYTSHYKDDSRCYDNYLSRYKQYLKGGNQTVENLEYLIENKVYDIDLVLKTKNWKTYNGNSLRSLQYHRTFYEYESNYSKINKYYDSVSKNLYSSEISKYNRILDFGNTHYYHRNNKRHGVVDKSDYDYNNPYFTHIIENMDLESDSFVYLCALVDEDKVSDKSIREKVIKGKVLFIINNGTCLDETYGSLEDVPYGRGPSINKKIGQVDHYFSIKKESLKMTKWGNEGFDKKSMVRHYWKDLRNLENNKYTSRSLRTDRYYVGHDYSHYRIL